MEVNGLAQSYTVPDYNTHVAEQPAPVLADITETAAAESAPEAQIAQHKKHETDAAAQKDGQHRKLKPEEENSLLTKAIEIANKKLYGSNRVLEYSVHKDTHRIMIKVLDNETNKVIREIPPEHTLDQFARVLELAGLMVDEKR
jgi:flagellar protein FlaG